MDAAIVDTLNRITAARIASHLDLIDWFHGARPGEDGTPWHLSNMADAFMSGAVSSGQQAWMLGALAVRTPDVDFDAVPADEDWENLLSHLRTEIARRRETEIPHGQTAGAPLAGVV